MSWFYCVKSKQKGETQLNPASFLPQNKFYFKNQQLQIFAGGEQNLIINQQDESGTIACGVIISEDAQKILQQEDIANLSLSQISRFNGHFSILRWENDTIDVYSDYLGIRKFFYAETDDFFVISTRIDWILKSIKKTEWNLSGLAAFWGFYTPLSYQSFFQNINKSRPRSHLRLTDSFQAKQYKSIAIAGKQASLYRKIKAFALLPLQTQQVSLGLSGGIDSRLLFGYYLNEDNWQAHTFGSKMDLDVEIAQKLCRDFSVQHQLFLPEIETKSEIIRSLEEISFSTEMSQSLTAFDLAERLGWLAAQNLFLIDGGNGGLIRSEISQKLLLFPQYQFQKTYSLHKILSAELPFFLNCEIKNEMLACNQKRIKELFAKYYPINKHKLMQQLFIDFYIPNQYNSQMLYDQYISGFMPFAQPSVIRSLLANSQPENNFYGEMKAINPKLLEADFIRYNQKIPHKIHRHKLISYAYAKIKSRGKKYPSQNRTNQLLQAIKSEIYERLNSQRVKQSEIYDFPALKKNIDDYYSGNKNKATRILKWLSFDFFSEIVNKR